MKFLKVMKNFLEKIDLSLEGTLKIRKNNFKKDLNYFFYELLFNRSGKSSFSRYAFLSDLTDLVMDFCSLLLYVLII